MNQLVTLQEACQWATEYLDRNVSLSNVSYLVQYGKVKKHGNNGKTLINLKLRDFLDMYMSPFLSSLLIILLLEILSQYTNLSAVWVITLGMILGSCMYIIGLVHIDKLFVFAVLTKIKKEFNLLRLNKP